VLIYVLGSLDDHSIKVGKTRRTIQKRKREHEGFSPTPKRWQFLAAVVGSDGDERSIKNHFKPYRASTLSDEYFHPVPPVLAWVDWLRQQHFTATVEDEAIPELMHRVDSGLWLPAMYDGSTGQPEQPRLAFTDNSPWGFTPAPDVTGDDFYTNASIIERARAALGGRIDLDPASHPKANQVVQADKFYTIITDGTSRPWAGRVWCNPPFGNWEVWGPKINREWKSGRVDSMCVLLPCRAMSHKSVANEFGASADAYAITRGRIPFWGPKAGAPDDGHCIMYFGDNPALFAELFDDICQVSFPYRKAA
jgi:hypothetical protein